MNIKGWYNELIDPGYDFSNPGFSKGNGHFTQLIWAEVFRSIFVITFQLKVSRRQNSEWDMLSTAMGESTS